MAKPVRTKVVLVGCGAKKLDHAAPARELYTGALVKKSIAYGLSLSPLVYIVSAEYGLVALDAVIEPYNRRLDELDLDERRAWANRVRLRIESSLGRNHSLVILAGETYAAPLREMAQQAGWPFSEPLKGLEIGERLRWLNEHTPPAPPVQTSLFMRR
jgi:hypothetical protein